MALVYQQIMTPRWLEDNAFTPNEQKDVEAQSFELRLEQDEPKKFGKLIFLSIEDFVPDYRRVVNGYEITVAIDIAFDYRRGQGGAGNPSGGESMSSLSVVVAEHGNRRSANEAIGFRIEGNLDKYVQAENGPYRGIQGTIARNGGEMKTCQTITAHDDSHAITSKRFPQLFRMLIKPNSGWGTCYSALDGGHVHVADYGRHLNLSRHLGFGIYSDEDLDTDYYSINYIDFAIYKED